jgi:hypothetical protein
MLSEKLDIVKSNIDKYPIEKLILWVGAGIDADEPTNLPLGNGLADAILLKSCGEVISENIISEWSNTANNIKNITANDINISNYPRLETILEGIRIFEKNLMTEHSVLKGLESFKDAPPNSNHYILAELLHHGANIVTTNYESCIAKAYNEIYKNDSYYLQLNSYENLYVYESNCSTSGKIYYIHGIAQHIDTIGATLSTVKNPLTKEFAKQMDNWIKADSCFIYLGYGGVDALDVNPYFRSRQKSDVSMGVYIQHSDKSNEDEIITGTKNAENLISCFRKKYILSYNTSDFLNMFTHTYNFKCNDKIKNYEWEKNYDRYSMTYPSEYHNMCALSILYLLNLNPKKVLGNKWPNPQINYFPSYIDNWFPGYYGFQNCIRCGENNQAHIFTSKLSKSVLLKSDIRTAKSNYRHLIKTWLFLKQIENNLHKKIQNQEIIEWEISTPINRLTKSLLYIYACKPYFFKVILTIWSNKLNALMQMLRDIIHMGSLYVIEINQMNVAHANLALLELIINRNYHEAEKHLNLSMNNYVEVCSISGIINVLSYEIICNEIIYSKNHEERYKNIIINRYIQLCEIIKCEQFSGSKENLLYVIIQLGKKIGIELDGIF